MPITPGGGDNNKNVEYVYVGCSSDTDISTAKAKYKLSTPKPGTDSEFKNLFDLVNYTFGSYKNEFVFTETGIFFIGVPLQSAYLIAVHTFNGYRTGALTSQIGGYEIFCDKDNNIMSAVNSTNISQTHPIFWAFNTNIPTK